MGGNVYGKWFENKNKSLRFRIDTLSLFISIFTGEKTMLRCSRSLIKYFAQLGKCEDESMQIDLKFVRNHLDLGADVNFPDKHGQTMLHEVARGNVMSKQN